MIDLENIPENKCPLCGTDGVTRVDSTFRLHAVVSAPIDSKCERCGEFSITVEALAKVDQLGVASVISGISREWTELERRLEINKDNLQSLINLAPKTLKERKRKFLQSILRKYPRLGEHCYFVPKIDYPLAHVGSIDECKFIIQSLLDVGLITKVGVQGEREVYLFAAKGWEEAESIEKPAALREKAFVAMWFGAVVKPAFHEGIAPAIEDTGYRPIMLDLEEHSESIIDRILAEIKEARFVVADFTGQRGGVYFEAGFARGLGSNVIWTCRKDDMANRHFDIQGFNVIDWSTPADLRERLSARIRVVVGYGPLQNPATRR